MRSRCYGVTASFKKNSNFDTERTIELIKKAQKGDKEAQAILVDENLGLVKSLVSRFDNRGYERDDIFQLGSIGLIKAIHKFDSSYGVRFSTYAVPMIVGEIKRFLRDDGIIKVSRNLKQTATKVKYTKESLVKRFGREPTINEIADELNIDKEEIILALESNIQPDYLYDVIHQNDGSPIHLIDKISETKTDTNEQIIDNIALKQVLNKLKPRERQIIVLRYFKDKTQSEIAKSLGISQVQVSRIEKKVLGIMKNILEKT
ncbi:RNA polymerase sporulation sigma factor SigF [Maledivibacter halophilus]|uniref:RNA polymerase sigma factor n=1 Tax=Maledivibacter halophilus TaxID=36842 RepID=A0A1T5MU76_9FIRM|nr:RNA polymerase sporulation sigma factor SigF [Maledivibacter halophilus]SKC91459.1 RNA polymerase, sigma subunit, RpoX/SigF [Maledivibacter halophilus]